MKKTACFVILFVYLFTISACVGVQAPKPKVMLSPTQYPNSKTVEGVAIAILPFDPNRDLYADPNDPNPRKPDFNWFKAGVCPARFIIANDSAAPVMIDPTQITCTDDKGVTYKPYDSREAGDAVVSSQAFGSYVKGAIAGVIIGALLGAGIGAALGGGLGGARWAARGAAIGAASGGGQGLVLGAGANRVALEAKVRMTMISNQLLPKTLFQGMTDDGLIYFPAVQIKSVRLLLSSGQKAVKIDMPIIMPMQEQPAEKPQEAQPQDDTQTGKGGVPPML